MWLIVAHDFHWFPFAEHDAEVREFEPTAADRDLRDVISAWSSMSDEQRREWLQFAEAIRAEPERDPEGSS